MPQTMEEHLEELEEGGEVESQRRISVSSFDESQVNEEFNVRQAAGNLVHCPGFGVWLLCGLILLFPLFFYFQNILLLFV